MPRLVDFLSFRSAPELEGKAVRQPSPDGSLRPDAPEVYGTTLVSTAASRYSGSSARRQLELYGAGNSNSIDIVAAAVDVIADTAATADYHLENPEGKIMPLHRGEAQLHERVADPWLVQLLAEPNPETQWAEMVKLAFIDWVLTGDAFIYMRGEDFMGRPLALYRLAPWLVDVVPGDKGQRAAQYKYDTPGGTPIYIPAEQVIHWRKPNPHDPYRGVGLAAKGPRVLDTEIALTETKASYYEQGARLQGVLESDAAISDTLAQKIRRQFQGLYAGARQAFQVAVLGRGLSYTPIQSNAVEAEFVQMTELSRDRILADLRVPRAKLGLQNDTSATTAPAEERRTFANDVMRPALDEFQDLLTRDLTSQFGLVLKIDYEYQMPIEEQYKLAGEFASAPGVLVKEVRERLGLPPLVQEMDDEKEAREIEQLVLNMPGENDAESDTKDANLPREAGRPPAAKRKASFQERGSRRDAAVR